MAVTKNIVFLVPFIVSIVLLLATFHSPKFHKARYIFVDLGANRADSLEAFLKHKDAKFTYDFPRPDWATHNQAGEYLDRTLLRMRTELSPRSDLNFFTEIYLFEANPYFNTALVEAKERYDALRIKVNIFPSTVVDVKDGTRTFFLDSVNTDNDFWGSSTHANHPDAVASNSNGTELSAINISRWLLMNTLPRDFVVVKMDIEGAEYEVIPHMAEMSVWTVVDHLFVEWHPGVLEDKAYSEERVKVAQEVLIARGVNMPSYDSAA